MILKSWLQVIIFSCEKESTDRIQENIHVPGSLTAIRTSRLSLKVQGVCCDSFPFQTSNIPAIARFLLVELTV